MKNFSIYLCAIFMFLLMGCSSIVRQPILETSTSTPVELKFTSTQTFAAPTITSTLTPIPVLPSFTQTPFPTLTSGETKTKLFNLLVNNGGCNLPCLLGYSPRLSTRQDMQSFFNQFRVADTSDLSVTRSVATDGSSIGFYIRFINNYLNIGISTYENEEEIEALGMGSFSQPQWDSAYAEVMKYYMLPQILTNYGKPSQVLVLTFRNDQQRPDVTSFPFYILLIYQDQGFYVGYKMNRVNTGINFKGCPSESFVSITTWSPGNTAAYEKMAETVQGNYLIDYKSISDVTTMTLEEFYQVFSNPDVKDCIVTPIEKWPNP